MIFIDNREKKSPPPSGTFKETYPQSSFQSNHEEQKVSWSDSSRTYSPGYSKDEKERLERIALAEKVHQVLDDYTFRLAFPCNAGTGWVLDYELPSEEGKYPTTWYFGTAAHVVRGWRFTENPYKQVLPISEKETEKLRARRSKFDWTEVGLLSRKVCYADKTNGYFDIAITRHDNQDKHKADWGLVANKKIEQPKLFYTPVNFLQKDDSLDVREESHRDFAVIEITFKNEEDAKRITNDFATKYPVNSTKALNIFASSLTERYTEEQLNKLDDDFYHLGYAMRGGSWNYTTTFNSNTGRGLRLSEDEWYSVSDKDKKRIRGLANANRSFHIPWEKGKIRSPAGSHYVMKSDSWSYRLSGGASGGLVIDKDGNMLGVLEGAESRGGLQSFWVPLRQSKIEGKEFGDLRSPKYDFILGSEGQTGSYREQVETYKKRTWLQAREWKHKTS